MTIVQDLLKVLDNNEEPLQKRIKIADNAFRSVDLPIKHKEAFLLKWILHRIKNDSNENIWSLVHTWISSEQFKELNQNDISNIDILSLIKDFSDQLEQLSDVDPQILNFVVLITEHKVFQQYFKFNLEVYCRFLSLVLQKIESPLHFVSFIKNPYLFSRNILVEEKLYKYFLELLLPVIIQKIVYFNDNKSIFEEVSRIAQKCVFQGNLKNFESFFAQFFDEPKTQKENLSVPKAVFKYLTSCYNQNSDAFAISSKLIFHAFSQAYSGFSLQYKLFIFLLHMIGFDISKDFKFNKTLKIKIKIKLSHFLNVLLSLLDIISNKNFNDCEVSKISFTEFLRSILKSLLFLNISCITFYEIILKLIDINPLVIEPIASQVTVFAMLAKIANQGKIYEKVFIAILDIFTKLHRVESFFSKLVQTLKSKLIKGQSQDYSPAEIYVFIGEKDVIVQEGASVSASNIFTENILLCFTKCICGLASWQVINLLKTLLHHFKVDLEEYEPDNDKQDSERLLFLEILGTLTSCLLQSVKMAGLTIPQNVVVKFVKGLNDLKDILERFGSSILEKEHNHVTMRTFLNMAYVWAEVYMTLTYYSINDEVEIIKVVDNNYTACNLMYLHSYLNVKQWQLISQRINNFGGNPCKKLLQKLYIQKLRSMLLFEKNLSNDIVTNVIKTLQNNLEDTWKDVLLDKFTVNFILPKMDSASLKFLAEQCLNNENLTDQHHITDSVNLTNAVTYVTMSKINKLLNAKRKHNEDPKKPFSSKIFSLIPESLFLSSDYFDTTEIFETAKRLFDKPEEFVDQNIESKQENIVKYLNVFKKFPVIYSSVDSQKIVLIYLFALYNDILNGSNQTKLQCEDLLIGILQSCKFQIVDIFKIDSLCYQILKQFDRYDILFSLITENVFKNEESIRSFEPCVSCLINNLEDSKYLETSMRVVQAVNKIKKSKMSTTTKEVANGFKESILNKTSKLVCKSEKRIEAYATCLKHYLSLNKESEILKKLLDKLNVYIDYSLTKISDKNAKGCMLLFTTILHNKRQIKIIGDEFVLKVWNACKKVEAVANETDEYSNLVKLIVTLIPNDEFHVLVTDLLTFTEKSIQEKNFTLLARQLKTWKSILTCDVNPVKMKIWQEVLENVIHKLLDLLKNSDYDETLFGHIVRMEENIIQTQHFILSSGLIDMFIITVTILMTHENKDFENVFNLSIAIMEQLLKFRNALIMDRLPAFLQQYRILLKSLSAKSNSDQNLNEFDVKKASDCAHKLEKLTKNLVFYKKDLGRITVFLIADILERYEQINLCSNVKLHLNNCIYSLISLCDHHAVSYLMRSLSSASTEMFKILYEHYKKYYMFTGKV